jgi:hypothetical protein
MEKYLMNCGNWVRFLEYVGGFHEFREQGKTSSTLACNLNLIFGYTFVRLNLLFVSLGVEER